MTTINPTAIPLAQFATLVADLIPPSALPPGPTGAIGPQGGPGPAGQAAPIGTLQGTWNPLTNTPPLTSGVGTNGFSYLVSVNGVTGPDGITNPQAGGLVIFSSATGKWGYSAPNWGPVVTVSRVVIAGQGVVSGTILQGLNGGVISYWDGAGVLHILSTTGGMAPAVTGIDLAQIPAQTSSRVVVAGITGNALAATIAPSGQVFDVLTGDPNTQPVRYTSGPYGLIRPGSLDESVTTDVFVYGTGAAGLMAGRRAAQRNLRVYMAEPERRYGGMMGPGSLTYVDTPPNGLAVSGMTQSDLFARIATIDGSVAHQYQFQPKTGQQAVAQIMCAIGGRADVNAHVNTAADLVTQSAPGGTRIAYINTPRGWMRIGSQRAGDGVVIDASYAGDFVRILFPTTYLLGQDATTTFGEVNVGYQVFSAQTVSGIPDTTDYPAIADPGYAVGQATPYVQAYNFRCTLYPPTTTTSLKIQFPKPPGYDPALVVQTLWRVRAISLATGNLTKFSQMFVQANLAGGKVNSNGADLPNRHINYPTMTWPQRAAYQQELFTYQASLWYCMQNDTATMTALDAAAGGGSTYFSNLQASAQGYGLCADEFPDSPFMPGWSEILYTRESVRMPGRYTMTQADAYTNTSKTNSIGKWCYANDVHPGLLFAPAGQPNTLTLNGYGPYGTLPPTFQISADCILPPDGTVTNFAAPWCYAGSNFYWSIDRMEIPGGYKGEAAGEMAYLAISNRARMGDYNYAQLAALLTQYGSVL